MSTTYREEIYRLKDSATRDVLTVQDAHETRHLRLALGRFRPVRGWTAFGTDALQDWPEPFPVFIDIERASLLATDLLAWDTEVKCLPWALSFTSRTPLAVLVLRLVQARTKPGIHWSLTVTEGQETADGIEPRRNTRVLSFFVYQPKEQARIMAETIRIHVSQVGIRHTVVRNDEPDPPEPRPASAVAPNAFNSMLAVAFPDAGQRSIWLANALRTQTGEQIAEWLVAYTTLLAAIQAKYGSKASDHMAKIEKQFKRPPDQATLSQLKAATASAMNTKR